MGEEPRAGFFQPDWDVRGDVYNVNGDLILSKDGSTEDFVRALESLRVDLAALEGIPPEDRAELEGELQAAAQEAKSDAPSKDAVVSRLSAVKARLDSLSGVASGALTLGKTVARLVAWFHGIPV